MGQLAALRRQSGNWSRRALFSFDRNVYLLLLFTLGKGFQLSIQALSTQLYVHSLGFPLGFVGLVAGMPAIGSLVTAVPVGLLADKLGRKPLLLVSGVLNPLSLIAIALSTNPAMLLGFSFLNGVLSNPYWVTNIPVLTESTAEDQRVWVLALNNFLLLGVGACGGLIGGAVPELVASLLHTSATSVVPLRWGVIVAGIVVFLPAPAMLWLRETGGSVPAPPIRAEAVPEAAVPALEQALAQSESHPTKVSADEATQTWRQLAPLFLKLLVPDVLYTTGLGAGLGLLQVFFVLRFHVQPGALGVLYTVVGLAGGVASLAAPQISRKIGRLHTVTTMQYLAIPIVLLMGFAPLFLIAGGADFGYNILAGIFAPVYAAFTMEQVSARYRATLSGFYSVTWSVGYSIGPTIAGWLQQHVGLSVAFVVSAGCIGTAGTLLRIFFGRQEREREEHITLAKA